MLKAAIDIDGTLTAWPAVLGPLSHALTLAGWDVVLLTGCSITNPSDEDRKRLLRDRQAQVAGFGATFREIVVCTGENSRWVAKSKALYCFTNGISLLIDDSADYCQMVKKLSKETLVLQVWK